MRCPDCYRYFYSTGEFIQHIQLVCSSVDLERLVAVGLIDRIDINKSIGHDAGTSTDSIANKEQQHDLFIQKDP